MSHARTIGDIIYKRRFYKLDGECMMRSIDSKDTNIKVVTNTNCALVGTFIVFKDSTIIGRSGKTSKYSIASNESARSTLVNKVISDDKCKLKDIAGYICFAPAFQDFSKIGSGNGSPPLSNASISTITSAISDEKIASPVAVDERSINATVDERSGKTTADERKGKATADERSGKATADERSGKATADERSGKATADERSGKATADERSGKATADERSGNATVDERSGNATVDEISTRANKSINKYCHDTKSLHSSQLNQDGDFDHKMNSENTSDLEKFLATINLVNSDIVKKSGKLLRKLTLVYEMLSYFQATQSVCRLSVPKNIFGDDISSDENRHFNFNLNKNFHSAGEYILYELQLYLKHLKADFKDWEAKRLTILCISESIPRQFVLCYSNYSKRVLMHNISTRICTILNEMNDITSKREERDVELMEIGDGIERYIRFSSSFIKEKHPSNRLF